jgi:AbrB family looped-hinge helix DNA binding protein
MRGTSGVVEKEPEAEVLVTRKGQTTIPVKLRRKYKIEEGTKLQVTDTGDGILLRRKLTTFDLFGSGANSATVEEMNKLLDELRAQDE